MKRLVAVAMVMLCSVASAQDNIVVRMFTDSWPQTDNEILSVSGGLKVKVSIQRWVFILPYGWMPLRQADPTQKSWVVLGKSEMTPGTIAHPSTVEYVYDAQGDVEEYGIVGYIVKISAPPRDEEHDRCPRVLDYVTYEGETVIRERLFSHPGYNIQLGATPGDPPAPEWLDIDDNAILERTLYYELDGMTLIEEVVH